MGYLRERKTWNAPAGDLSGSFLGEFPKRGMKECDFRILEEGLSIFRPFNSVNSSFSSRLFPSSSVGQCLCRISSFPGRLEVGDPNFDKEPANSPFSCDFSHSNKVIEPVLGPAKPRLILKWKRFYSIKVI